LNRDTVKAMQRAFFILGIIAAPMGLVWIGQGSGYFPYPAYSFMVRQTQWAWYGAALLAAGLLAMLLSRRG
jgi:hypothetical protein